MKIEWRNITNTGLFSWCCKTRVGILSILISTLALVIFYLYKKMLSSTKSNTVCWQPKNLEHYIKKNRDAIKDKGYLTRLLFRGSIDKQEIIAQSMALDLGIPVHIFDGRKVKENLGQFNDVLRHISSGETPELVFVSHADEMCHKGNVALNIVLVYTGSASQKLLLCLGVSSAKTIPEDLATRYPNKVILAP